ncbi:hypothetical protein K7432_013454, partial [Basidiobolus ranarum]
MHESSDIPKKPLDYDVSGVNWAYLGYEVADNGDWVSLYKSNLPKYRWLAHSASKTDGQIASGAHAKLYPCVTWLGHDFRHTCPVHHSTLLEVDSITGGSRVHGCAQVSPRAATDWRGPG